MEIEKSGPRVGLILKFGALSVATLIGTHVALVSYFDRLATAEEIRKTGSPEPLMSLQADEKERLGAGSMPIEKAMQELVARGRMTASPDIMPSASRDVAPLQGWSKMPAEVPPAMMLPPVEPPGSAMVADAGAGGPSAAPGDGGGAKAGDAGSPKNPPTRKKQP
jgi:hypothetical protein